MPPAGEAVVELQQLRVLDTEELRVPDPLGEDSCDDDCEGDALSERTWLAEADCTLGGGEYGEVGGLCARPLQMSQYLAP